ncbi:MAG: hypothetical protein JRC90_10960 [Deltaproteobacteria bacterium]|nr:hypothetical protein [Deltaproteobacteria bacterium]
MVDFGRFATGFVGGAASGALEYDKQIKEEQIVQRRDSALQKKAMALAKYGSKLSTEQSQALIESRAGVAKEVLGEQRGYEEEVLKKERTYQEGQDVEKHKRAIEIVREKAKGTAGKLEKAITATPKVLEDTIKTLRGESMENEDLSYEELKEKALHRMVAGKTGKVKKDLEKDRETENIIARGIKEVMTTKKAKKNYGRPEIDISKRVESLYGRPHPESELREKVRITHPEVAPEKSPGAFDKNINLIYQR